MRSWLIITAAILFACDKGSSSDGITPPKDSASSPSLQGAAPVAPASASTQVAAAAPSGAPSAASSSAPPSAAAAAPVTALDAGRPKDGGAVPALKPASKQITGKNFALDITAPGCRAGEPCTMAIKLATSGDYHVNKEYPYKFIATPAPGVVFLGKSDANMFTRASGDFVEQGEKTGTMTVRFKPSAAGPVKVAGKYKLSVCSADQCQIEEEMVELDVPVM